MIEFFYYTPVILGGKIRSPEDDERLTIAGNSTSQEIYGTLTTQPAGRGGQREPFRSDVRAGRHLNWTRQASR